MEKKAGWRATPAPLLVAFAAWLVFCVVRVVIMQTASFEHGFSTKLFLTSEGIYFACTVMVLLGAIELMNRAAGSARTALQLSVFGAALVLTGDTLAGFLQFTDKPWDHEWVYKAYGYVALGAWSAFVVGLTLAAPAAKRVVGFVALGLTVFVWLPQPISDKLWEALSLKGKSLYTVEMLVRCVQIALVGLLAIAASAGETSESPRSAAEGFRSAARGLWIRVITAVIVVLFTLMLIAGKGEGGMSLFKLVMIGQVIVSLIALLITGLGALRAARAGVSDLQPYVLAIGGGASLWAVGVSLSQVPYIFKALYGGEGFGSSMRDETMTALTTALPVVVIIGVGLLATALSGFAARRNNEDLRTEAQGKGIGYVVLMLAAIGIQGWMLPKASSVGSFAMLSILAAVASLWGTVMMAKLLGRGADALEQTPELPQASVIPPG